jgi:hypothetical protein
MDVEILTLCDAATEHAGKMNLIGVFDSVFAASAPITLPPCHIAVRVRFMSSEAGNKVIRIVIIDADGKRVQPPPPDLNISVQVAPNAPSATAQILLGTQQLQLPHFGEYSIALVVDGREEKTIPLFARQIQQPQSPPGNV